MTRGFWLAMDAVLGLVLVTGLLLMYQGLPAASLSKTIVLQKEFDLFKVWDRTHPSAQEMQEDIEWLFPLQGYEVQVGEQVLLQKNTQSFANATTGQGIFWRLQAGWTSIRLTVYH